MKSLKNLINFTNLKPFLIITLLLCAYVYVSAISYVSAVSSNISNSVFRLHVIANSDTLEDQNLKLKVRDELLLYMNKLTKDCSSKSDVMQIASNNIDELQEIAKTVIINNGFDYNVSIEVAKSDFPTKQYGDIALPAGSYDALRVKIGSASGQNWWCVMFPPLCFVDVSTGVVPDSSKEEMKQNLSDEEYDLISKTDSSDISFKFKLVELFQNWKLGLK